MHVTVWMSLGNVFFVKREVFFIQLWRVLRHSKRIIRFTSPSMLSLIRELGHGNSHWNAGCARLAVGPVDVAAASPETDRRQFRIQILVYFYEWVGEQGNSLFTLQVTAIMSGCREKSEF